MSLDATAREYVVLVRDLGAHSDGYIDALYGPAVSILGSNPLPSLPEIADRAGNVLASMPELTADEAADPINVLRRLFLKKQLVAIRTYALMLSPGAVPLSFDEEASKLYDATPPRFDEAHFQRLVDQVDELIPGRGTAPLTERYAAFKSQFVIPVDRLDAVFRAAIEESRSRTKAHISLPAQESFDIRYVTDKPWSGYNWYKGSFHSVIEVNTDLPIYIDRAVDLAAHEGYPGHHVFNCLLEEKLVVDRGFVEFGIYPLFSPQSLIAEGTANYGIGMVFPTVQERVAFESTVLFPLAGLDAADAHTYYLVEEKAQQLSYAGNEVARGVMDGSLSEEKALEWLCKYALMAPERAAQRLKFIRAYRAYVINYNVGQDMVRDYLAPLAGDREAWWARFAHLLATPQVPSNLASPASL